MEKEKIKLSYPFAVGDKKQAEYARNGIVLTNKGPKGYTRIDPPFELGLGDFATLSQRDLHNLDAHIQGTKYTEVADMAKRVQQLRIQAQGIHLDGFQYPTVEKPFTWDLHNELPKEVEKQLVELRNLGISEVKVGLEMEFSCPEEPVTGFDRWLVVKSQILSNLQMQASVTYDDKKKSELEAKILQINDFNAREIMMYELIELNSRSREVLEPLFGQTRDGDGYYDGRGVLELKLKPVDPVSAIKNRSLILKELYDTATQYGLEINSHPSFHINVSLWDKNGNIFDDQTKSFEKYAKYVTQGVTKAFYDAVLVILNKYDVSSDKLVKLALDVNRQNLLRYSSDRVEVRPSVHSNFQDPDIMLSVFLAGAIYGLKNKDRGVQVKAVKVESPIVHHTRDTVKVTSHLINNSTIADDGILSVSEEYIGEHIDTLEYELGIVDTPPDGSTASYLYRLFGMSDNLPFVTEFFKNVGVKKLDNSKFEIVFPETSAGKYTFTIPAINLDKIPLALQLKLAAGNELTHEELQDYLAPGERIPRLAKEVTIDVNRLKENICVYGTKSKYVVKEYDLNKIISTKKPNGWTNAAWSRYKRLQKSSALKKGMTHDFKVKFTKLAKDFAVPEVVDNKNLSLSEAKDMFVEKIKDRDYVFEKTSQFMIDHNKRYGHVEGVDFLVKYIKVKFEDIHNPKVFEYSMRSLFSVLNSEDGVNDYRYVIDKHAYADGSFDVEVSFDPKALPKIKEYISKNSKIK